MELVAPTPCGPAPPVAVYTQLSTAIAAIQTHAKAHSYALFKRDSKPKGPHPIRLVYACDRAGKPQSKEKRPNIDESKRRRGVATKALFDRSNLARLLQ
jgi:hypothetical protein